MAFVRLAPLRRRTALPLCGWAKLSANTTRVRGRTGPSILKAISGHVSSGGQSAQVYRIPRHPRLDRSSHCSQIFDGIPDGVGMPISFPWPRLFTDLVAHNPAYGCTAHCPRRTPACKRRAGHTADTGADCRIRASSRHPGTPTCECRDQQHRAAQSCYSSVTHFVHLRLDRTLKHLVAKDVEARLEFSVQPMNGVQPIRPSLRQQIGVARMPREPRSSLAGKVSVRWQTRWSRA
ncbi:hypothetical protein RSgd_2422 [Ralstonia solanacearum]|nr:hypothetical protein [Ralstonia solanacearum]